jgi:hypothetical protein
MGLSKRLKIFICGVPPGISVSVFDERKEKDSLHRALLLEKVAGPEYSIETEIDREFDGVPVKVLIRAAGFLPYEFKDKIEEGIGLFHAAKLEIDRVYSGSLNRVPDGWNSSYEHRKAEKIAQIRYRRYQKDNKRARWIKRLLDFGFPFLGFIVGFMFDPIIGSLIGLVLGIIGGQIASRFAKEAMGLD